MSEKEPKKRKPKKKKEDVSVPDMPMRPAGWLFDLYQPVYVLYVTGEIMCEGRYCGPSSSEKGKHIVKSESIMMIPPTSIRVKEDADGS